jgi:hypothetical protein
MVHVRVPVHSSTFLYAFAVMQVLLLVSATAVTPVSETGQSSYTENNIGDHCNKNYNNSCLSYTFKIHTECATCY